MLSAILWFGGGIVVGVIFDETFRAIWAKVKAKKDEMTG